MARQCLFLLLFVTSLAAQEHLPKESFSFGWITDLHVGNTTGEDDLRAAVELLNRTPGLDFVVASGDITESGTNEELYLAKQLLDNLAIPYYIIPGNHDTKWSESGGLHFSRLWGADRFVFSHRGVHFIGLHQGPRMRMADGHWAPEDMRWLDEVLETIPDTSPLIFVTHYPIDPSISNWYEALDRLNKKNTILALTGHGHQYRKSSFDGIRGVMSRSTLRGQSGIGGCTVVEVSPDSIFFREIQYDGTNNPKFAMTFQPAQRENDRTHTRPDDSVNARYPSVNIVWEKNTGYTIAAPPSSDGTFVAFGDASGTAYVVRLDNGALIRAFRTGGPIVSTPTFSGEYLIVPSTDATITCYDIGTAKTMWTYTARHSVIGSPLVKGNKVFIGASDGSFRALDMRSGQKIWSYDSLKGFVETTPVIAGGLVLFGAWDTYLYALDEETGALRWKWSNGRSGTLLSPAACTPVVSGNTVFIVAPDRMMTALDLRTGKQLWRTGRNQVRETIGISEDKKTVFVRTMMDSILAFPASRELPDAQWIADLDFGYDINSAQISVRDGILYYPTKNGLVHALEAKSGKVLWKQKYGNSCINTPVPLPGSRVLLTDFDGNIRLVEHAKK